MTTELLRFITPVTRNRLPALLARQIPPDGEIESTGFSVDLSRVYSTIEQLMNQQSNPGRLAIGSPFRRILGRENRTTSQRREFSSWDARMVAPVHQAFRGLSRRLTIDMGFWQWLCIYELRDYVLSRWFVGTPPEHLDNLPPSLSERFIGTRSLRGISRNAFSRYFWCAEALYSDDDGYRLAEQAFSNQDFFQAIFEREFGLYTPAARACLQTLRDASEYQRRAATKKLNRYLTTILLEGLSEADIRELILR